MLEHTFVMFEMSTVVLYFARSLSIKDRVANLQILHRKIETVYHVYYTV